ncbi:flagellar filament capping protein FliD [Psychrobacillus sp. FJAT-51614]|uniref:Flagellar hook-associated protein 2 n=1 Tax=Psychrobacillus mangrovi TaxID=3117745 RepID=A0ABU8F3M0_9BACI
MAGMRIGGLASGMDIDQIVGDLMKAERIPLDKLFQKRTTFEWQRDSYRAINTKLKSFDTYLFDNFSLSSNFNKKTVESSNANLVSATATGSASSNLSIEGVSQLATAARQIGNTISTSTGGTATGATKMSELSGISGNTTISLKAIQSNGTLAKEATNIEIKATDTIDQVISKINNSNAGVSALFENGKLSITAKNTGDIKGGAEVQVSGGNNVFSALGMTNSTNLASGGTNAVFQVNGIATERSSNTFTISGYNVTLKSTFNVKNTLEEQVARLEIAKDQAIQDVANAQTAKDVALNNQSLKQSEYDSAFNGLTLDQQTLYTDTVKDSSALKNTLANLSEEHFLDFKNLTATEDADIDSLTITDESKKMLKSLSPEDRVALQGMSNGDFTALKDVVVKNISLDIANLDVTRTTNDLTAKETLRDQKIEEYNLAIQQNNNTSPDASVPTINLTASSDINAMVDKVKEFVEKYNELIGGMNTSLKEKKYRDFPPLTDEQRKDMSEKEQELWDEKAKSGLLRSDSIVSVGLSEMRNAIYGRVGIEDNIIDTLAEMGVTTSSAYSDGGKLVINEDKLRKALTENPDQVVKTLTRSGEKATDTSEDTRGIVQRLRDSMKKFTLNIEKKAGKASSTDQQYAIGKSLIDTNSRISNFQRRLEDIESRYWRQFTAMEQAISKANQQSAFLMGQSTGQ